MKVKNPLHQYATYIEEKLDSMFFYSLKKSSFEDAMDYMSMASQSHKQMIDRRIKLIKIFLVFLFICFGIAGGYLHGKVSVYGRKQKIESAVTLNKDKKYFHAIDILENLIHFDSPIVLNELGVAYSGIHQFNKAERLFKKALTLLPEYGKAHNNLMMLYADRNKVGELSIAEQHSKTIKNNIYLEPDIYGALLKTNNKTVLKFITGLILAFAGILIPYFFVTIGHKIRMKIYEGQLADALLMMSNDIESGMTTESAIIHVAQKVKPPLSQELGVVLNECKLSSIEIALKHLFKRMPTLDTRLFVNSILIQKRTGMEISKVFKILGLNFHERKKVKKKIRSIITQNMTKAVIVVVSPIILSIYLNYMLPKIYGMLYNTRQGIIILVISFLIGIAGLYWLYRISRIEV